MATYDLGKVVGEAGEKGDDGSTVWNTSTAPTYANSKYTFTISNLSGKTGLEIAVNDIIFYSTYYYIVSAVNTTTVDCSTRVSIKGSDASVTIVTSWEQNLSDVKVPSEKLAKNSLDNKVDKENGKGLFSGSYTDLSNKPSIPSSSSDLSDGSDLIKKSNTTGLIKNDGSVDRNTYLTSSSLSNYVQKSNTSGLLKNDGTVDTSSYITSSAITGMLTSSDIADNLTTNDSTKVLSAKQGKVLNDMIGSAITYIIGSGS